ncbi:MAG: type II toxin-antitoxin system RelB/DinJ family antitoxin [Clostridiales bacterium]|nr:type II toxin-antitoxin system RelB/DinJ family antitoxin [Clostridiales bacterium]
MVNTNINIRINSDLKNQFEAFCEDNGLSMSTAVNMFVKKTVRDYKIPFDIGYEKPNAETIAAIKEVQEMKKHLEEAKTYSSAREMIEDVLGDV